jgi:hypothetical protein
MRAHNRNRKIDFRQPLTFPGDQFQQPFRRIRITATEPLCEELEQQSGDKDKPLRGNKPLPNRLGSKSCALNFAGGETRRRSDVNPMVIWKQQAA